MADLKSDNILMALRDQSVLDRVAWDELEDPLPQRRNPRIEQYSSHETILAFNQTILEGP